MSGYLTNLLRRTFEPSPAMVQPRFNALFAPPEKSSALEFTTQQPEPVGETTNADEHAAARSDSQPSPLPRVTTPTTARNEISSPLPAASTRSSPEMSLSRVVPGYPEQAEALPSARVGAAEAGQPASRKPLGATLTAQTDRDSKSSTIIAKPLRERTRPTAQTVPTAPQKEQAASLAHAEEQSPNPEVRAPLIDQPQRVSGKPSEERVRASDRPRTSGLARPADVSASKSADHDLGDPEPLASQIKTRDVVDAFPPPSVKNREASRTVESKFSEPRSVEPILGRGPLSFRPAVFRQWGRQEPERTESPEPTIEVTIGRIEVRGTVPTEPRRPAAQPSRGLSLEEYLRRRSGRSRE
jgi:hypothetical protein